LSPLSGRLRCFELNLLVEAKAEFAFESTLSGLHYAKRIQYWKAKGYLIENLYSTCFAAARD